MSGTIDINLFKILYIYTKSTEIIVCAVRCLMNVQNHNKHR